MPRTNTHTKRRHWSRWFLLAMLLQSLGWWVLWCSAWLGARAEARKAVRTDRVFVIARADMPIHRLGEREICIGALMYDILRSEPLGDSLRLYLYADQRETRIMHYLQALMMPDFHPKSPQAPVQYWWKSWKNTCLNLPPAQGMPQKQQPERQNAPRHRGWSVQTAPVEAPYTPPDAAV